MRTAPKLYYGLHMVPGVAEYKDRGRILVNSAAIKKMDPTFQGKPVYVMHKDEIDLDNKDEIDGYVVRSFFNKSDGQHWVEFMIVSDRGNEHIARGWKLSNAYLPKETAGGGLCHGVQYDKEIMNGEYEHLAIVPNPRYQESIILTPDQFKEYNDRKEIELKKLSNSKEEKKSMFNIFKKQKVENAEDLESLQVTLPKSKREGTIAMFLNEMDLAAVKKDEPQYANGDHKVKVGDGEMTVNELVEKYMATMAPPAAPGGEKKENNEPPKEEKKENNEPPKKEEKKENNEPPKKEEKKENSAHFNALKNAADAAAAHKEVKVETSEDRVNRGKSRYGSKK